MFFLLFLTSNILAQPNILELRYDELVNYEIFDDHGAPRASWFDPFKCNTIFKWTDEIFTMTQKEKDDIYEMIGDGFANLFSHYIEIKEYVTVDWADEKAERYIRLYLQETLMEYLYDELEKDDYFDTYYWIFPPFSSFKQRINCFMVWYSKVQ